MADLSGPEARFRSRRLSTAALQLLTQSTHAAPGPATADAPAAWAELVDAGIATGPGQVRRPWAELFAEVSRAEIAVRIVSRAGSAGMLSTVTITPRAAVSITERRRLRVTETEVVVEAVEDAVEIAVFDPASLWPAVQRLLPPSPVVRADGGRSTALAERTVAVVADARTASDPTTGQAPVRVDLPASVLAELASADVEVSLTMHVDQGEAPPAVTQRHWAAPSGGGLLEVRVAGGAVSVVDVPAGTIADELVWLATGALDGRARAMRAS